MQFRSHNRLLKLAVTLALAVSVVVPTAAVPATADVKPTIARDRFLVKFKTTTDDALIKSINHSNKVTERRALRQIGVRVLNVPKGKTVEQMISQYQKDPRVASVEPDHIMAAQLVPNDPLYPDQWGLTAIGAPSAWDLDTGNANATLAVLDTGIDASHPDLAGRVVAGYDFINRDSDANDDNGHGTIVAGIAGANGNSGAGVAGVNWGARLMPVKVLDASGTGLNSTIAEGIIWAADHNVSVINMSLSGSSGSSTLASAITYAFNKGTVLVGASGNDGSSVPQYPSAYPEVMAVGALSGDTRSSFSSYGWHMSLMAPGSSITSTKRGGTYTVASGTSMAAPFVAGVVATLRGANPSLSPTEIQSVLQTTATDLGAAGWDSSYGFGRVDMAEALTQVLALTTPPVPAPVPVPEPTPVPTPADTVAPTVAILSPTADSLVSGRVTISAAASDNIAVTAVRFYADDVLIGTSISQPHQATWKTNRLSGSFSLTAVALDAAGNSTRSSAVIVNVGASTGGKPPKSR